MHLGEIIRQRLEKQSGDYAQGLPDPTRFGRTESLAIGRELPWVVQLHDAENSGLHRDVRFGQNDLYSWATKKELPNPGGKIMLFQQPLHCFPANTLVETIAGPIEIGKIVKDRLPVKVLSVDDNGKPVFKAVTNYWSRPVSEPIVHLAVGVPFKRVQHIRCTRGHQVFSRGNKIQAGALDVGDEVDYLLPEPNFDQKQIIWGCLLGDGHISDRTGVFRFSHSDAQRDYFFWQVAALSPFSRTHIQPAGNGFSSLPFHVSAGPQGHPWFVELRKMYGTTGKQVSKEFLEPLNELALAVWYQDDGSIQQGNSNFVGCSFATHGFSLESVEVLRSWLLSRFGLKTFKVIRNKDKGQWEIRLNSFNALKLFSLIAPYVHPSMSYKLVVKENQRIRACKGCGCRVPNRTCICDGCVIRDVSNFKTTVEHAEAYYAGNTLISPKTINNRCGTWDKAKQGVVLSPLKFVSVPTFQPGTSLPLLDTQPVIRPYALKIVRKMVSSPHKNEKMVYDLEVEETHRYVVRGGFVVSNSRAYGNFEGTLTSGYGKGTVKIQEKGKVTVSKATADQINFIVNHPTAPRHFTMVRRSGPPVAGASPRARKTQGGSWLLINTTPMEDDPKVWLDRMATLRVPTKA